MATVNVKVDRTLECIGLACPMPVVRTKKTMDEMKPGQVLEVRATDKGSVADLQGWAKRTGHHYIGLKEENGVYRHYIRKTEEEAKTEAKYPHTIQNEELMKKLAAGEPFHVIDVREPAEFAFGHIPAAVSIPLGELDERAKELDPNQTYMVVCRTGNRSNMSCLLLTEKGFKSVINVLPGMSEWTGPVEIQALE